VDGVVIRQAKCVETCIMEGQREGVGDVVADYVELAFFGVRVVRVRIFVFLIGFSFLKD
jgi:hypothetical protein